MFTKSFAAVAAAGLVVATSATVLQPAPVQAASKSDLRQQLRHQERQIRNLRNRNRALRRELIAPAYRQRSLPRYRVIETERVAPVRPVFSLFGGQRGPGLYLDLN
ncbi:hypothetical protein [Synechococcus sp. RS9916]|uniref:hypothetical protein n=1 Tax=Synechococcus sp. RS9916 TaxID=221359 RepID=UPI0002D6C95C|nr:hypothetical protein [Synechococcus sp. RS9916]